MWGARPLLSSVVSLCAQPRKGWLLGLGSWTLCTQQGGASQLVGMGQSQDKGLVVPSEKTQTWVSLRLELPVRLLGSHKGDFVWLRREEAPRPSANGLAASEPQLTAEITPVTLSLADRADGRPDGHVWDKSVLCASGLALSDPDQTRCVLENRVGGGSRDGSPRSQEGATSAHCRPGSRKGRLVQRTGLAVPCSLGPGQPHVPGTFGVCRSELWPL